MPDGGVWLADRADQRRGVWKSTGSREEVQTVAGRLISEHPGL